MIKRRKFIKIIGSAALVSLSFLPQAENSIAQTTTPMPTPTPTPTPSPKPMEFSGHVIAEPCIGHKDTTCAVECPVEAIYGKDEDWDQLFINPDECIDCGKCVDLCPYEAIYTAHDLPDKWKSYVNKNRKHFGLEPLKLDEPED